MPRLRWELPAKSEVSSLCKGSFDCVALRFANGNFAQDDRLPWLQIMNLVDTASGVRYPASDARRFGAQCVSEADLPQAAQKNALD